MKNPGLVAFVLVVCLPLCAFAAEQRIGFINATVIFEQFSGAREAEDAYQKELEDLNEQVTKMEGELQALADTLEARRYVFSDERLQEKRAELEKKQQEYLKFRQEAEARAAKRNDELSRPIVEAIEAAAKSVAEKEGLDLVLDSGPGIVVYSKPELDITDRVLQELEETKGTLQ